MSELCPCGSSNKYLDCCGQFIENQGLPATPEQLMRSRFCAYTTANIGYIEQTMCADAQLGFDATEAKTWAQAVKWLDLTIVAAPPATDTTGLVHFKANFIEQGLFCTLEEKSDFHFIKDRWFYVGGETKTSSRKLNRNEPCPCGSAKKYKRCRGK